jgi:hypothetical protein
MAKLVEEGIRAEGIEVETKDVEARIVKKLY